MELTRAFRLDVPVLPDEEEARRWMEEELSRPVYEEAEPGLTERALAALAEWLDSVLSGLEAAGPVTGVLVVAVIAAVVLLLVVLVVRPRLNASPAGSRPVFDDEAASTAVDHRRLARDAAGRSDWNEALTQLLRAMIRSAEERVVLDPVPGQTATEAASRLVGAYPDDAADIRWLAERFNEVRYGNAHATAADAARAQDLDARLLSAAPAAAPAAGTFPAVPR